jgi:menaquinone-dependent protoporphyrinogen oxidase
MKVFLLYATKKGSTTEVAHFIADVLRQHQLSVDVVNAENFAEDTPLMQYDAFIFGSAVYTGMWLPQMIQTVTKISPHLGQKPVFCWLSCIRILEPEGYQYVKQNYLPKEVEQLQNLQDVAVFAGHLNLEEVDFEERWTLAVRYDGKSNPGELGGDFRNWELIREWAEEVALKLTAK